MTIREANEPLSSGIKIIIAKKGLKQIYIAEKAGFTSQELSDMLNGRKIIKPCDSLAIADALEVTMNELYAMEKESDLYEAGKKGDI